MSCLRYEQCHVDKCDENYEVYLHTSGLLKRVDLLSVADVPEVVHRMHPGLLSPHPFPANTATLASTHTATAYATVYHYPTTAITTTTPTNITHAASATPVATITTPLLLLLLLSSFVVFFRLTSC